MLVRDAQHDLRNVFLGGSPGAVVAALLWLTSSSAATWYSKNLAVNILLFGGVLIFPGALVLLRVMGRSTRLAPGNPLGALAMQVAFTVPLAIPVILAATRHRPEWFYPAFMIVVGAHYLPFIFLYGMWQYGVLAGLMMGAGLALRLYAPDSFTAGGWITGAMLLGFAVVGWAVTRGESTAPAEISRAVSA